MKTVAVFAFEVISKEDNSFIGKGMGKMLCSRIGSDNTIQVKCMDGLPSAYGLDLSGSSMAGKTAGIAQLNGVDYILAGTVTIAGDSVSSDARLIEVLRPEQVKFINASGTGVDDIMNHASAISEKVQFAITGNTTQTQMDSQAIQSTSPIHPMAGAFKKSSEQPTTLQNKGVISPLNVSKKEIERTSAISSFHSSILLNRKFDMEIRGIATSDIDGDARLDMVVMDDHAISFFSFENNNLVKKSEYSSPYYNKNISIDALDLNGNGRSELFITSLGKNNYLKSYIIEWNGREFETIIKDVEWYFRVVAFNGKYSLAGQQRGHDEIFLGSIYALDLSGNKIIKNGQIGVEKGNFDIFSFAPISASAFMTNKVGSTIANHPYIIWFDRSGFLNLGDERGAREWKSPQSFGSTAMFIEQDKGRDNLKERVYINSRIFTGDIDNDGIAEIITASNSDMAKGYLSGYRKFNQGNIQVMAWKDGSMVDIWKGNPATGYISDFNIMDMDGDSYPELIYSVVTDTGIVMNSSHSTIFIEKIVDLHK
ncbi:MAG: VCBS repeat-containing protein [Desulfamplus sp.]|nr:VCBS repeat-containing protein [Desulfamplus sp.]